MKKSARPRCLRCPRKAGFEAVYCPVTRPVPAEWAIPGGAGAPALTTRPPEPVAQMLCGWHLLDVSSHGPVQIRRLRPNRYRLASRLRAAAPGWSSSSSHS